ncbi:MAG: hypothetical protein IJK61_01505, partial [Bacteroidetes bacterium]|nr:hypothetical protein [Bacteroidota bacterium]
YSVGIDMVEIARIKKSMKNPRFLNFILGEEEYDQLKNKNFTKKEKNRRMRLLSQAANKK